ncbi:unnamed protein product [Eruca vesicaria subsp. sativa]|uniref:RBR-type E3 ubiquitin transferase n=1 Tax=Eruca vesicaria subsp. sativa TaxID=29727 RepID=A0ABC8M5Z2_ERUVS|nr:unnamed protein product [Eruca vesicaria subsp. sativa]
MASSSSERVPITPTATTTLANSRVSRNPSSEEEQLKAATFDEKRDNEDDDLIAYVAKPESELKEATFDEQRDNDADDLIAYVAKPESEVKGSWTPKQIRFDADVMYRIYSKGLVSEESGSGSGKGKVVAGFGVAICDQRDALLFESKGQLDCQRGVEIQALTRGLMEASKLGIKHVTIFCDSFPIFQYVRGSWTPKQMKISMLMDDLQRIRQQFTFSQAVLVAGNEVKYAYKLARESIVSQATPPGQAKEDYCHICFNNIDPKRMFGIGKCSHQFCFQCVKQHVEVKLLHGMIPNCPHDTCKSEMVIDACGKLLTPKLEEMWKQRIKDNAIPVTERVYCPYLRCSALMSKTKIAESAKSLPGVRRCVECRGLFCVDCKVPWHGKLSCSEYKKLHPNPNPPADDVKLKSVATNNKMWRQCGKCQHMIEVTQGCNHITCRCGHEFCYNCGGGWNKTTVTCVKECPTWDEAYIVRQDPGRAYVAPNNYFDDDDCEADEDFDYGYTDFPFNLGHLMHDVYPTVGGGRNPKPAQQESSVAEPRIQNDLKGEMKATGHILSTKHSFFNVLKGDACLLWDVPGKRPSQELAAKNWKRANHGGPVRNQGDHDNCWTYTSTDVFSCHRLKNKEDKEFRVMSARYLTFYVSKTQRKKSSRRRGKKARRDHKCHGYPVIKGLEFIKEHGVPAENPADTKKDYSCVDNPPPRDDVTLFRFGADVEFLESNRIEDLHEMLLHQAVSADMILYQPEYDDTRSSNKVYEGPSSVNSLYIGWHAVLVLAILRIDGKWVALVKTSHGAGNGKHGYMYISLCKMLLNVKYTARTNLIRQIKDEEAKVETITTPSYLLRKFTGVNYAAANSVSGQKRKRD